MTVLSHLESGLRHQSALLRSLHALLAARFSGVRARVQDELDMAVDHARELMRQQRAIRIACGILTVTGDPGAGVAAMSRADQLQLLCLLDPLLVRHGIVGGVD